MLIAYKSSIASTKEDNPGDMAAPNSTSNNNVSSWLYNLRFEKDKLAVRDTLETHLGNANVGHLLDHTDEFYTVRMEQQDERGLGTGVFRYVTAPNQEKWREFTTDQKIRKEYSRDKRKIVSALKSAVGP